jgi:hypothetical protein
MCNHACFSFLSLHLPQVSTEILGELLSTELWIIPWGVLPSTQLNYIYMNSYHILHKWNTFVLL